MARRVCLDYPMAMKMTDDEWRSLAKQFDPRRLLDALNRVDSLRQCLNDQAEGQPSEIRIQLAKLYEASLVVNKEGNPQQLVELFDRADELDAQVCDMMDQLANIQRTLAALVALRPEILDEH